MSGQKIVPHLWFATKAKEAAEFYTSAFKEAFHDNSHIKESSVLHNTPSGDVDVLTIELSGYEVMMISAGPLFTFTPAISFLVVCRTTEEVDVLWEKLSHDGKVLMELGSYPFSEKYGWVQDKYGLSWQVMLTKEETQRITPTIMYVGDVCGKAESAVRDYVSVFHQSPFVSPQEESTVGDILRYAKGEEPDEEGTVKHIEFTLAGQSFAAMDSAHEHQFTFNEAISFIVNCNNQEEIDYYWDKLSAVPESEQCGWLKDKYGVSWQIVPIEMNEMMSKGSKEQIDRVTQSFLKMKKFDLAELRRAYEEK